MAAWIRPDDRQRKPTNNYERSGTNVFSTWDQMAATAVATAVLYAVALVAVRVAGRRTLARISAFDAVVTVALGTLVASAALPSDPTVADGIAALATLLVLQVILGALRQRFPLVTRYVDFRPYVVARGAQIMVRASPLTAQMTEDEVAGRLRSRGTLDLSDVDVVVLEPTGELSVLPKDGPVSAILRKGVKPEPAAQLPSGEDDGATEPGPQASTSAP